MVSFSVTTFKSLPSNVTLGLSFRTKVVSAPFLSFTTSVLSTSSAHSDVTITRPRRVSSIFFIVFGIMNRNKSKFSKA